jgi:MFS transporter, FSR family, fosmidomycin resistance protein
MPSWPSLRRDTKVNAVIGTAHFLSHFYALCLPPLFVVWQKSFGVPYAEVGLSVAVMASATAVAQTPVGILVDRFGARAFLVGGALLMALSIAAMGLATAYWQIVLLALLAGLGNAVFHPADYAILSGSVGRERLGRSFALHTFNGYVGFAAAPPVSAGLLLLIGWRETLFLLGLLGLPIVLVLLWQSRILSEETGAKAPAHKSRAAGRSFLLTRPMLLFCGFYLVGSMATAGMQSWLITVLHQSQGMTLATATSALTSYLVASLAGTLAGGWLADRSNRHLAQVALLSIATAALTLFVGAAPLSDLAVFAVLFAAGFLIGISRTPRDMMVKDAAPAGETGKAFGFVSAGLSLGSALAPVPYGFLIDAGRPRLVLVAVAALLVLSVCFAAGARFRGRRKAPVAAE